MRLGQYCVATPLQVSFLIDDGCKSATHDGLRFSGGLAFFNCGEASGHSQPHKHVQIVPLPLGPHSEVSVPIQPLVDAAAAAQSPSNTMFSVTRLPFRNYCRMLPQGANKINPQQLAAWQSELRAVALQSSSGSYNLLLTRHWMMAVPRSKERGLGLALNALAFAGTILVRSASDMERVKDCPMAALAEAGVPW